MFNPFGDSNEAFMLLMGMHQQNQQQQSGCQCCGYWPCVYDAPPQPPPQQDQQATFALITLLGGNGGAFGGFQAWDATQNHPQAYFDPSSQFSGPVSTALEGAGQGGDYTASLVAGVIDQAAEDAPPTWPPQRGWVRRIPGGF